MYVIKGMYVMLISLPEQVSSSYAQRRAESQQRHPTTCCEPETAGYQYMDPDGHRKSFSTQLCLNVI